MNFFAPAVAMGSLTAGFGKLLWWRELQGVGIGRLAFCAGGAAAVALAAGLVVFGRDGKMATYGASVLATALAVWWCGFIRGRRR